LRKGKKYSDPDFRSGVTAIVLSVLNYLWDKPRIKVTLQWDMKVTPNLVYDSSKLWSVGTVKTPGAVR